MSLTVLIDRMADSGFNVDVLTSIGIILEIVNSAGSQCLFCVLGTTLQLSLVNFLIL